MRATLESWTRTCGEELGKRKKPREGGGSTGQECKGEELWEGSDWGVKGLEKTGCPRSGNADREWISKGFASARCLFCIPQTRGSLLNRLAKSNMCSAG